MVLTVGLLWDDCMIMTARVSMERVCPADSDCSSFNWCSMWSAARNVSLERWDSSRAEGARNEGEKPSSWSLANNSCRVLNYFKAEISCFYLSFSWHFKNGRRITSRQEEGKISVWTLRGKEPLWCIPSLVRTESEIFTHTWKVQRKVAPSQQRWNS